MRPVTAVMNFSSNGELQGKAERDDGGCECAFVAVTWRPGPPIWWPSSTDVRGLPDVRVSIRSGLPGTGVSTRQGHGLVSAAAARRSAGKSGTGPPRVQALLGTPRTAAFASPSGLREPRGGTVPRSGSSLGCRLVRSSQGERAGEVGAGRPWRRPGLGLRTRLGHRRS